MSYCKRHQRMMEGQTAEDVKTVLVFSTVDSDKEAAAFCAGIKMNYMFGHRVEPDGTILR